MVYGILEDFRPLLSGSIADIGDLLVFFHVVNGFQSRRCGFGELGGNANIGRNRDITRVVSRRFASSTGQLCEIYRRCGPERQRRCWRAAAVSQSTGQRF